MKMIISIAIYWKEYVARPYGSNVEELQLPFVATISAKFLI